MWDITLPCFCHLFVWVDEYILVTPLSTQPTDFLFSVRISFFIQSGSDVPHAVHWSLYSLHHRFTLVFTLQSWGMRLVNPLNFPKKDSRQTRKHRNIPAPTDRWVCSVMTHRTPKCECNSSHEEGWDEYKVLVTLCEWTPTGCSVGKPWTEQQEDRRLMAARWDDVTIFSSHSSRGQHVSEQCDRHRARHRH